MSHFLTIIKPVDHLIFTFKSCEMPKKQRNKKKAELDHFRKIRVRYTGLVDHIKFKIDENYYTHPKITNDMNDSSPTVQGTEWLDDGSFKSPWCSPQTNVSLTALSAEAMLLFAVSKARGFAHKSAFLSASYLFVLVIHEHSNQRLEKFMSLEYADLCLQ